MNKHTLLYLAVIFAAAQSALVRQDQTALEELEEYIAKAKLTVNPRYRLTYHVAAPVGWINDPNGFSFFQGSYHLFYQYYPYDSVWGPMHWGHVISKDLVTWQQLPTALLPEKEQCFSGSAVSHNDTMYLIYTAHEITDVEPFFNQTQFLASSTDGVNFSKYTGNPIIPAAPNGSPDFRDPKVWRHEDHWYVVIGSKTDDDRGRVLLYRSKDLISWDFLTVLAESTGDLGYMWECPDFFELDGKYVLLWSPQGIEPQGDRYKNTHQTGYFIGDFNYETFEFVIEGGFTEIDYGHDFYATQTMEHNGRRVVIGWFGMWEVPHPEDVDGWAGAMTIVRELHLGPHNHITMTPITEMMSLRENVIYSGDWESEETIVIGAAAEIILEGDLRENIEIFLEGADGGGSVWVRWNSESKQVIVDRGNDDVRQVEWYPIGGTTWRLFLDTSSLELFCGEGEVVFSSRVYPLGGWVLHNKSKQRLQVSAFSLKRSVPV